MPGQDRILSDITWLRDVHDAQEGARAFRAARDIDSQQRAGHDFFAIVARIWLITILLLVLGALIAVILEEITTKSFSSPSSSQIYQSEK
jgi:uncharacterized protein involved in exopolysaccharide biosynthesis